MAQAEARWQHPTRSGEARPQRAGGRVGEQEKCGWADIPVMGGTQCVATRQGQVVEAAWPQAGSGQMPGPIRANQGTEPMSHTEVKMDRSQNMTPSELNHRGKRSVSLSRMDLFEDARLSLPASALSCLPAPLFIASI